MTTRVDHSMLGAGNDLMPKSGGVFTGSVTNANGTDNFDAGSVSILVEGY